MGLLKGQTYAAPQRGLPVDDKGGSSKVVSIAGETVQLYYWNSGTRTIDAGQAAGVVVEGKLEYDNIKNEACSMEGTSSDTSLSFTSTALTTEVQFDTSDAETYDSYAGVTRAAYITDGFANGEYVVDYTTGMIYGKKASTQVTLTTTGYKVSQELTGSGGGVASDVNINKVGGNSVSTLGSQKAVPTAIYDDTGAQITSFGSPSTIAEFKSPSDFAATYTSTTTITLSSLPFSISDSSQVVYIRVIPATGDAEVYTNGSGGVTMLVSSNVLTIAGAGTPFTSGDVYEVGINGQVKSFDASTDTTKTTVQNPEWSRYTSPEQLVTASDIVATTTVYKDQGSEIDMEGYNVIGIFVKFTVNDSLTNTIRVLSKHESGGSEEFVLETSGDYIKTLGDASINIYYEFETNGIPILQIQSTATTVGATEGQLEITIVKGNK